MTACFANFFCSTAFSFGAIYDDNTATFKGERCARETNEVILNVHVISVSLSDSISDSTLAFFWPFKAAL